MSSFIWQQILLSDIKKNFDVRGDIQMHAYLIMAHKNVEQLKKLLKLLDATDNDIFLHIDKKASHLMKNINSQKICTKSSVVCVPSIDVKWGG